MLNVEVRVAGLINMRRNYCVSLLIGCLLSLPAIAGIRGPGKYNGVVIFDRWGGCHLYSGAYVMEIAESVKELLRPYANQLVLIDAKEVVQPMNPGDGLITKLMLGPSEETTSEKFGRPPLLDALSLKVLANFAASTEPELIIELRNTGTAKRRVNMEALAPTLLAKKQGLECFFPSDGPSFVAVTRTNINFMHQYPVAGGCQINGRGRTTRLWLFSGVVIPKLFEMDPGQSIEVPLQFELSQGEYEFLAGYGGGVHEARTLVSNRIAFDIDETGTLKPIGASAGDISVTRTRRAGAVCGRVASEDGSLIADTKVYLWPAPLSEDDLRAANHTTADRTGAFRMENVMERHYALSAVRIGDNGVYTGASGGGHLTGAASLALPVFPEDCSIRVVLHPAPTFTVRGKTAPPPADKTYSARISLKEGDAYPFAMSVPISSDGHYEFKSIPGGRYQFFAGNLGSGFNLDHDIENFNVNVNWGILKNLGASPKMPMDFYEAMASSILLSFHQNLQTYESQFHLGFPAALKVLGQPPSWASRDAEHAGLVDDKFPGNEFADDGSYVSQGSYGITYKPGAANENGKIVHYLLSARPLEFGKTGRRSFVIDESGKVHSTDEDRAATLTDPTRDQ